MKNYTVTIHSKSAFEIKLTHFDEEFNEGKLIASVNEDEEALFNDLMLGACWDGEVLETMGLIAVAANNYLLVVSDDDTGKTENYSASDVTSELINVINSSEPFFGYEEVSKGIAGSFHLELNEEFSITKLKGNITEYGIIDDSGKIYTNQIIDHWFYKGFNNLGSSVIEITTDSMNLVPLASNIIINSGVK